LSSKSGKVPRYRIERIEVEAAEEEKKARSKEEEDQATKEYERYLEEWSNNLRNAITHVFVSSDYLQSVDRRVGELEKIVGRGTTEADMVYKLKKDVDSLKDNMNIVTEALGASKESIEDKAKTIAAWAFIDRKVTERVSKLEKELAEIRGKQFTMGDFVKWVLAVTVLVEFITNLGRIVDAILSIFTPK